MKDRVVFYGKVLSSDDPLKLGRIRCQEITNVQQSVQQAIPLEKQNSNTNDQWSDNDNFVCYPLLPIFINQIPKEGEFVHIIYYDKEHKENNRFYVQGNFSNLYDIEKSTFDQMIKGLGLGERNTSNFNYTPSNWGLYLEPNVVGIYGRKNSDLFLPDDGFMVRVNKQTGTGSGATFNKKYGFSMIQTYPSRQTDVTVNEGTSTTTKIQNLNYLIEYNIYGGLNSPDDRNKGVDDKNLYSGYVEIYKISPYNKVSTSGLTETSFVEISNDSKIGPIFRKDYLSAKFETIVSGINQIITNLNNSKVGLGDVTVPINIGNFFPFYYQPSSKFYMKFKEGNSNEQNNAQKFMTKISLNTTGIGTGIGLVSEKDTLGPLIETEKVLYETPNPVSSPTTVKMSASDFQFFLSHETSIDGLNPINFQDFSYIVTGATTSSGATGANTVTTKPINYIKQEYIWENIYPNTNSMVRGEKLLELLELIVNFMINHVHPYHGMPPVSAAMDGTTTQQVLTKMFQGYEKILNNKLRLN
jgi:hypothetical protein